MSKLKGKYVVHNEDEDMLTNNFDSSLEDELDIICNMITILPIEYDSVTEVAKEDKDFAVEMENHYPLCYYVMNNGCVKEQKEMFERPYEGMKQHLNSLFIWAKVEETGVNKVLVDGGASINLTSHYLLKKIVIYDTDMIPNNMVLSNYEAKTSKALGVIQVNIIVGIITRPTLFVVITTNAN